MGDTIFKRFTDEVPGSRVPEAPTDGRYYARTSSGWKKTGYQINMSSSTPGQYSLSISEEDKNDIISIIENDTNVAEIDITLSYNLHIYYLESIEVTGSEPTMAYLDFVRVAMPSASSTTLQKQIVRVSVKYEGAWTATLRDIVLPYDSKVTELEGDVTELSANVGDLANLTTTQKANLVAAINEVKATTGIPIDANFVGFFDASTDLPTVTEPSFAAVGTNAAALALYKWNDSTSGWVQLGSSTYDFTGKMVSISPNIQNGGVDIKVGGVTLANGNVAKQSDILHINGEMASIEGGNIPSAMEYRGYIDGGVVYPNANLILFVFPVIGERMVIRKSRGNRFVVASFTDIPQSGSQGASIYTPSGTIVDGTEYVVNYTPATGTKYIAIYIQSNTPTRPTDAELRESINVAVEKVNLKEINTTLAAAEIELGKLREDVYVRELVDVDFSTITFQESYLVNAETGAFFFAGNNTKACEIAIPATSKSVTSKIMYTGGNSGVAFMNADKEYISGYFHGGTAAEIKTLSIPEGAKYFRYGFNSNQFATPQVAFNVLSDDTRDEKNTPVYVSPTGNDANDGSKDSPFATFAHAISKGYKKIFGYPGIYHQSIDAANLDELSIVSLPTTATRRVYDEDRTRMARICFDNSVEVDGLELDTTTGLYKMALSMPNTSNWYKVFISHELEPESPYSQSVSYNCILWEIGADVTEHIKMRPVLSLAECQSDSTTFFYDGTSLYVHPTSTLKEYYRLLNESQSGVALRFTNIKELYLEGIDVLFGGDHCSFIDNCVDSTIKDCTFAFSAYGCGSRVLNSNVDYCSCDAICARMDGFGINVTGLGAGGGGNASFYNCNGLACGDDGISHHGNTSGTIRGGKWMYNGKGGVAPSYGSRVDVYDAISVGNKYGLYLLGSAEQKTNYNVILVGCAFKNNTDYDLLITQYNATTANVVYSTKILGAGGHLNEL